MATAQADCWPGSLRTATIQAVVGLRDVDPLVGGAVAVDDRGGEADLGRKRQRKELKGAKMTLKIQHNGRTSTKTTKLR